MNPNRECGRPNISLALCISTVLTCCTAFDPPAAIGGWQSFQVRVPPDGAFVTECYPQFCDSRGNLWVMFNYAVSTGGGNGGLYVFDGQTWKVPDPGPLPADAVPSAEDTSGNLWFVRHPWSGAYRWDGAEWRNFTVADGLADSTVYGVLADRKGGVWFGSASGAVSRFDGVRWETFPVNVPGLDPGAPPAYRWARPLYEDTEGGIWFEVGYTGAARFHQGTWTLYEVPCENCQYKSIRSILQDREGTVWIVAYWYLFLEQRWELFLGRVVGNSLVPVPSAEGPGGVRGADGTFWAVSGPPPGLSRFDGNRWCKLTAEDGQPDFTDSGPYALIADPVGGLWLGGNGQVTRFDGERTRTFPLHVNVVRDQRGDAWGLGSDGAYQWAGTDFIHYTTSDGLASNQVSAWLQSRDGTYWLGTTSGVSKFDGTTWTSYTVSDNLPGASVTSLFEDTRGGVWAFTYAGASRFDGTSWRLYTATDGLPDGAKSQILEDSRGNMWATEWNYYVEADWVSRFDGSTWTTYTPEDSVPAIPGRLFLDSRGDVWALGSSSAYGQHSALSRFDGTHWKAFSTSDGVPIDSVSGLLPDRNGNMWASLLLGGLVRYDGIGWSRYATNGSVAGLRYDDAGRTLFITTKGVLRFDGDLSTFFPGPASCDVWGVLDPSGSYSTFRPESQHANAWLQMSCGLAKLTGTDFEVFTGLPVGQYEGSLEDSYQGLWYSTDFGTSHIAGGIARHYGTAQGFDPIEQPLIEDSGGGLWFGRFSGIKHYFPDRVAPLVRFTTRPLRTSRTGDLSFSFAAPFEALSGIEYSTRFDGGDWSDWTQTDSWAHQGVPDGPHVFEMRARDYAGNISPFPAVFPFVVDATPPAPVLASPQFGLPVRGTVDVRGTAADPRFASYRVDYRGAGSPDWSTGADIVMSATPVSNGTLGLWDTSSLLDGSYDIRLSVADSLGLVGVVVVTVVVDNHAPYFDETAPARVTAATGGNVYTTNAETHLYFPPHAFAQDAVVMVTAVVAGSVPASLPSGGAKVLDGYELAWTGPLEKPARFTVSYAGASLPPGTLALYHSTDGSSWERLGGTVDPKAQSISLAVSSPGRYALFADNGLGTGAASLSPIAFTPRVFSPRGSFADSQVGISFSLGRPAPVTVRVYSRSGRLVREVVAGVQLGAGANLIQWDGVDRNGGYVTDGMYLVTVEALGHTETKALAVVK